MNKSSTFLRFFLTVVVALSLSLQGCSGGGAGESPSLSSVVITPDAQTIIAGSTKQFKATANYSNGTSQDISSTVTWMSSDPAVASIDSLGRATSSTAGTTVITATSTVGTTSKSGYVTLAVTARARAAATGQTSSYFSGDDGGLQKGVPQPTPRFTNHGDGTISDGLTGLMWLQDGNCIRTHYPSFDNDNVAGDGLVVWQHALDYARFVNNGLYPNCSAGYSDWRLPNINELKSVANAGVGSATWLNSQGFVNIQSAPYWSSTTELSLPQRAFVFPMRSSYWVIDDENKPVGQYVMLVRDGSAGAISLPRTGQTACFDTAGATISCSNTGQDADLKKGLAFPNPRFTNSDGTTPLAGNLVTDQFTGLVWTRSAKTPGPAACLPNSAKTWLDALRYIDCLNTNSYEGFTDWRLANINEYQTLFSNDRPSWLIDAGFDIQWGYFLSSTAVSATEALSVTLASQQVYILPKDFPTMVWPVRGGS